MHVKISILPHMELSMCMYSNTDGAIRALDRPKLKLSVLAQTVYRDSRSLQNLAYNHFPKILLTSADLESRL